MTWDRRSLLRGVAALATGLGGVSSATAQTVDTSLPAGAVLFDLDDDGSYDATVERATDAADDARPAPIRITSGGRETVDYAAAVVEPEGSPALGDLDALSYDYRAGSDDADVPDETFLVVETDGGRRGAYLTYHDGGGDGWRTHDVLARVNGDTAGTSGWFEYTPSEGDGERTFDDAVERFGPEARLVRVGVGRGDGVDPTALDAFYGALVVGDRTYRFPVEVAERRSEAVSR